MENEEEKDNKKGRKKKSRKSRKDSSIFKYVLYVSIGFLVFLLINILFSSAPEKLTQQEFLTNLEKGKYSEVSVKNKVTSSGLIVEYKDKKGKSNMTTVFSSDKIKDEITDSAKKTKTKLYLDTETDNSSALIGLVGTILLPLGMIVLLYLYMTGKLNMANKDKAKQVPNKSDVTFANIAGKDEEKNELKDIINYFNDSTEFDKRNLNIPRGVLLEGEPGTGKTLLAKGLAGEIEASFYYVSGADFNGMFRGSGTSSIKSLFAKARENAPSIVFIDEFDAVGKRRTGGINDKDSEQTLNQLLVELDGFQTKKDKVVILAATNLADSLDPAVLRSGRFDRKIYVGLPNKSERTQILDYYTKDLKISSNVDMADIGEQIQGFSGADIENLVNEANMCSYNNGRKEITSKDFDQAMNKVIVGVEKKSTVYTKEQKIIVANHESGHALVGSLLDGAKKVKKVTIIPHGRAGGFAMMMPKDEMFVHTKDYLENTIVTLLAGRGAEEIMSNTQTSGVSQDIKEATEIARNMVGAFAMTDSFQYRDPKEYKELSKDIDDILNGCYEKTKKIINDNLPRINLLSKVLQSKETLYEKEIDYIVSLDNTKISDDFDNVLQEILEKEFHNTDYSEEIEDNNYESDLEENKPNI